MEIGVHEPEGALATSSPRRACMPAKPRARARCVPMPP
eukprot:CAMPEP_0185375850 /NCGR_PEP_ID=MMETSP1364-20130426/37604_1 /TAXON_ID=38817 /ORGANISM="Gephyrocapsa oceanica, Strain RCC1303" /LENGTH=37 /DNA_ID= /DNA_START= /DNA_END= /DNA_ORIENTATION=